MNLALFDFDGTITTGDTWTPFLRFALPRARLAVARVMLTPVFIAYRAGFLPAGRGRTLAARAAFSGRAADGVRRRGIEYASNVLPTMVRADVLARIKWHQAQGDRVVVVSASLDAYLKPWCEEHGVELICTTLEERGGTLTGRCVNGDCAGAEKARRIQERFRLASYPVIYAYGDSDDDLEMLALAHRRYWRGQEALDST